MAFATDAGEEDTPISFRLAPRALSDNDIQVFNGSPAKSGDWRSIAISEGGTCTATFVGKGVLLTAAHCVVLDNNRFASPIRIGPFTYRCSVDPAYLDTKQMPSVRHPADYALCLAEPYAGKVPDTFLHVVWDTLDLRAVAENDVLLVAGYGCVSWVFNPSTGTISETEPDKTLAVGDFKVKGLQADTFSSESDGKTRSALCAGDSGGPAFSGVNAMKPGGARTIRGVASRTYVDENTVVSYFAALSTARFATFLGCWRKANPGAHVMVKPPAAATQGESACASAISSRY
ncbi:trypsin-like serine protease [Pseudomonas sp. SDO5271_S396]